MDASRNYRALKEHSTQVGDNWAWEARRVCWEGTFALMVSGSQPDIVEQREEHSQARKQQGPVLGPEV